MSTNPLMPNGDAASEAVPSEGTESIVKPTPDMAKALHAVRLLLEVLTDSQVTAAQATVLVSPAWFERMVRENPGRQADPFTGRDYLRFAAGDWELIVQEDDVAEDESPSEGADDAETSPSEDA